MFYQASYKAATSVSKTIEKHFQQHVRSSCAGMEQQVAEIPSAAVIEAIIDAAFWASLRKEEGNPPKISIAYLDPSQAEKPLIFENRIPLNTTALTKLAPGLERAGIHLGVYMENEDLYIWGTTLQIPNLCFVLDVSEPGLLVIKHRRMCGYGKFSNVAVLKGDQVKIIDTEDVLTSDSPAVLKVLLDLKSPGSWSDAVNIYIQLAVSMRRHQKGGILLVTPSESCSWRESIVQPIQYGVSRDSRGLHSFLKEKSATVNPESPWQNLLSREIDHLAGLTAIDGATVINTDHQLLAFGAKIARRQDNTQVEQMLFIEPVNGSHAKVMHPGSIGGTRHLAAAQFVFDQRDSFALVASQDGHFTVFSWSDAAAMVSAYRIESLLL